MRTETHKPAFLLPSEPGRPCWFIYYQVGRDESAAVEAQMRAAQADLQSRHPGLQAALMRRPQFRDGLLTLMEIYTLPAPLSAARHDALLAEVQSMATRVMGSSRAAERHLEVFEPCA